MESASGLGLPGPVSRFPDGARTEAGAVGRVAGCRWLFIAGTPGADQRRLDAATGVYGDVYRCTSVDSTACATEFSAQRQRIVTARPVADSHRPVAIYQQCPIDHSADQLRPADGAAGLGCERRRIRLTAGIAR
ncbi:hypothetical protein D3C85_1289080 [compost metagenome]